MSYGSVIRGNAKLLCTSLLFMIAFRSTQVSCELDLNKTSGENLTSPLGSCSNEEECKAIMRDRMVLMQKFDDYVRDTSSVHSSRHIERLKHTSVIYGLIDAAEENQLNQQCYNEIMQIYHGINRKEIWAMKILDSSGQAGSGFLLGNNHWLGSTKGCESVKAPLYITLSDRFDRLMKPELLHDVAPFAMDYRIVYAKHYSPWQVEIKFLTENLLHIGLCLPKSCSNSEIHNLTQEYLNSRVLDAQSLFEFETDVLLVKDLKLRDNFFFKTSVLMASTIIAVILLIVFCSWNRDERISEAEDPVEAAICITCWDKVLKSFSIQSNWRTLMDDSTGKDSISVINGIKSLSCFFILVFHMCWFSFYATSNPGVMFHLSEKAQFQWIANAALMVDAFFAISGFLVTYNFLKSERQMTEIRANSFVQNVKLFGKLLMHRYIRLSPVYLMVGLVSEIFTTYIVDVSKFWVHERSDLNCQRYWWRNVLYINNLFDHDDLCMNWTWSMACEMQYFLIFTIILFIYAKNKGLGVKVFVWLFITTFIVNLHSTLKYKFLPSFDVLWGTGTELYIAPWVRISPYCVGVVCGWFLNQNRGSFQVSKRVRSLFFFLSTFMLLLALHGTIYRDMGILAAAIFILVGRPLIAAAVSWFIVTNACGYNCLVSRIFSSKFFVRVNKLTYAIYLLNPIIITVFFGKFDNGGTVDPMLYFVLVIGITLMTYVAAIVFALLFEIPFYKLSNEMLKGSTPVAEHQRSLKKAN